ncbi:MAG: MFS transporter [Solirubrobacterales bacterium]
MTPATADHPVAPGAALSSDPGPGSRGVIVMVMAAMFADAAFYAVIAPLLPHYRQLLSLGHFEVALLFAAHPAGTVLMALPAARFVDSRGPATVMTIGLVVLAAAAIVFGLSGSLSILVACRFLQGASAAMVWCAGLARLQAVVAPERRGAALGLAGAAAGAGALGGPAFAALSTLVGIAATLVGLGIVGFALAVALFLLGELPGELHDRTPGRTRLPFDRNVVWPADVIFISGAVLGAVSTIAPLRLSDLGASVALISAVFACTALCEVTVSPLVGHASDRVGRILPMRLALGAAVPLLLAIGFARSIPVTAASVALDGGVVAALWPLANALLADRSSRLGGSPAEAFGLSVLAWSLGLGAGSLLCGLVAGLLGNGGGVAVLAVPCLLGLVLLGGETVEGVGPPHRLDPQTVNPAN